MSVKMELYACEELLNQQDFLHLKECAARNLFIFLIF